MDPNAVDLLVLEVLKQADPVIFTTVDGASYALAGSIPREVLEAFEALTPSVKYVKARAAWCLTAGDWLSCRERLISKLMKGTALVTKRHATVSDFMSKTWIRSRSVNQVCLLSKLMHLSDC